MKEENSDYNPSIVWWIPAILVVGIAAALLVGTLNPKLGEQNFDHRVTILEVRTYQIWNKYRPPTYGLEAVTDKGVFVLPMGRFPEMKSGQTWRIVGGGRCCGSRHEQIQFAERIQ